MTVDIAILAIRIDSSETRQAARDLDNLQAAGGRAEKATAALEAVSRKLKAAMSSIDAGDAAGAVVKMADDYTKFTAQLRLATRSQQEYATAQGDVRRIAAGAQQDLAATGALYARLSTGTRELGLQQKQVAALTETVSLAMQVSGASAGDAAAAQGKLAEAFAMGKLDAEGFNAIYGQTPALMEALASGMGVPIAVLKDMAEHGQVTAAVMAGALPQALQSLQEQGKHVETIGGAFTVLKNSVMEYVGVQAQAGGGAALLVNGMQLLAGNMNLVGAAASGLVAAKLTGSIGEWVIGTYRAVAGNAALAQSNLAAAGTGAAASAAALAQVPAHAAAVLATEAHVVAMTGQTVAARAATIGVVGLGRAVAVAMGPLGIIMGLVGAAATLWSAYGSKSAEAAEQSAKDSGVSTEEIIANSNKEIAALERRNKLLAQGAPMTKADTPLNARLAEVNADLGAAGKGEGKYADMAPEGRQAVLVALGAQYNALIKQIEAYNQAVDAGAASDAAAKAKAEAGNAAAETARKAAEAYKSLMSSIKDATAANNVELQAGENASASKKAEVKLTQDLISKTIVLTKEQEKQARAALADQAVSEGKLRAMQGERDVAAWLAAGTQAREAGENALKVEYESYGKIAEARELAMIALKNEAAAREFIAAQAKAGQPLGEVALAQLKADTEARISNEQAALGQSKALGYAAQLAEQNKRAAADAVADPKERARALLQIDVDIWTQRLKLAAEGTVAQQKLQSEYDIWYANQSKKLQEGTDDPRAAKLLAMMEQVDDAAKVAAASMEQAFGRVGAAIGSLATVLTGYARTQAGIAKELADATTGAKSDDPKVKAANAVAAEKSAKAQIKSYGELAGAAKGFFKENSTGYKLMEGAQKAFHAMETAMAIESMLTKSGLLTAFTGLFVASKTTEVAATSATVPATVAAEGVKQGALATTALAGATAVPFPGNIPAFAIVAGMLAAIGLGVAGSSGSGGMSAAEMQKVQGTGSVFGDSSAKSDSIGRSLERLEENSDNMLPINQGMLSALKAIESAMTGLTNLVLRTPGVTDGTNMDIQTGKIAGAGGTFSMGGSAAMGAVAGFALGGPLGAALGGAIGGAVAKLWGKTTQTIVDAGVQYGGSVRALENGQGFEQYASIDTTKKSWFGLSKKTSNSVQTEGLTSELSAQFALVFTNLDKSLQAASVALGGSAADVTKVLDNLTLETTKVSLKGLSGTELTQALNAVLSKTMDEMAAAVFPNLDGFRQVGEGYAETVMRLAADYAELDSILAGTSTTFGATGIASIAARERLIELAGGIDALASQSKSFSENFLTQAEQLAPVQKYVTEQLAAMGLQSLDTRDKFKEYVLGLANGGALLNADAPVNAAGQQQYVALLALADAFAQTHAATVDLTKSEQDIADERMDLQREYDELTMSSAELLKQQRDALDASNQALFDQVQAIRTAASIADERKNLQREYDDLTMTSAQLQKQQRDALDASNQALFDQIEATKAVAAAQTAYASAQSAVLSAYNAQKSSLQSIVDLRLSEAAATDKLIGSLQLGNLSTLSPEQKYQEAQRQFDAAAPGEAKNAAAQTLLEASRSYNGSTSAYARDYAKVQAALVTQSASQKSAAAIAQAQLEALDKQVSQLIDISGGVQTLNSSMKGLESAILNLDTAMSTLAAANAAAAKSDNGGPANQSQQAIESTITGFYKEFLGRAPEAAGLEFWTNAAKSGVSYAEIKQGFVNSDEYKALHGSHANGLEFVPFDGYRAELHRGERVQTAAQVSNDRQVNAEMVSLLRDVVTELKADKTQRGAAVEATVGGIVKELRSLKTATRVSAARASAETTA